MSKLAEFLAGERTDDVALFITYDHLDAQGKLANYGEDVDDGVVLVVPGDDGRQMFAAGTGLDAMEFAREAMGEEGEIHRDLGGGECPRAGDDPTEEDAEPGDESPDAPEEHRVKFIFAFAEEQNAEVGGIYEEGDVVHAYAQCTCGASYSDRWVAGAE